MTKALTMIHDLLAGRLHFEKEEICKFVCELEDEISYYGYDELQAIDPEFAYILDENINDISEKVEEYTPEIERQLIADVRALYDRALAVYYQRHPGAKEPE